MAQGLKSFNTIDRHVADAARGDVDALYDLGIAYSSGSDGVTLDLIEAHKWFNLAAVRGSSAGQACRSEIAREMSAAQIAQAQRQARAWLSAGHRAAA